MGNYIGKIIASERERSNLTQDQYGARYGVSGPAIFKFEKGYVRPSLDLWLKMAIDANVTERRAVLLWAKSKLPQQLQDYIELQGATTSTPRKKSARPKQPSVEFASLKTRQNLLQAFKETPDLPSGLRALVENDENWALYKPTGKELDRLIKIFAPLGEGTEVHYREALCLLRNFSGEQS